MDTRKHKAMCFLSRAIFLPMFLIMSNARASPSVFHITSDIAGLNCYAEDRVPGTLVVYVLVTSFDGAAGASFRVAQSAGFSGEVDTIEYLSGSLGLGDLVNGVEVAFTTCVTGQFPIAKVTYTTFGSSETCSSLEVAPSMSFGAATIEVYQCGSLDRKSAVVNGPLAVNADESCDLCALPAKTSTWGRVKALYR